MTASLRPLATLALCTAALLASRPARAQEAWANPEVDQAPAADPRPNPSDDARHDTTVVVHPDSHEPVAPQPWFVTGIVMSAVGGTTLSTGVFLYTIVAGLQRGEAANGGRPQSDATTTATVGLVTMAVGAAVVGGGIVAIATHPPATAGVEARDATVVAPTWREPAGVEAAVPKGQWVPVVGGRF